MIFMRTVDTENFEVVLEVLNDQSYMGVMRTLGERILFRYKNPTGHYRLDLSKVSQSPLTTLRRACAQFLLSGPMKLFRILLLLL